MDKQTEDEYSGIVREGQKYFIYKHDCDENIVYYEFYEDGHRYHGYECGVCGKLLQTG